MLLKIGKTAPIHARHRDYENMYEETALSSILTKTYQTRIFVLKSSDGNQSAGNSHNVSIAVELWEGNISSPVIKVAPLFAP